MLRNSARTFGDLHISCLSEARRPANRWQQLKEKPLSPRRSFSPNTRFELPYRVRSPFLSSSSDEDERVEAEDRASRSPAPSPSPGISINMEDHTKKVLDPACTFKIDLEEDSGSLTRDLESHSAMMTPISSPQILDLGLSTPPPEGYMDDFITGIFMTLDENGEPVFPDDDDDAEVTSKERATPSAFLFLGDNGNYSVMNKENIITNAASHTNKESDMASSPESNHGGHETENGMETMELEGFGSGFAADLPGGYGTFHNKANGKRVLCYD